MIYLHRKFYNVIKINYGGPDTGHIRPAGRSLETPGLDNVGFLTSHDPVGLYGLLRGIALLFLRLLYVADRHEQNGK
jgi:hypothetical protein